MLYNIHKKEIKSWLGGLSIKVVAYSQKENQDSKKDHVLQEECVSSGEGERQGEGIHGRIEESSQIGQWRGVP
jgi:hypothetical protein